MTEELTICLVASCDRPSDGWYVCRTCGDTLARVLTDMGWMLDELDTVISQQTRYVSQSSGKSADTPMMFNVKAAETRAYLMGEVATGVRVIEESNGWDSHAGSEKAAALWLGEKVSAVRLHPAGSDIIDGIMRWWAAGMWVIDRPAQRQFLGECGVDPDGLACGGRIYGRAGKPEASCDTCGGVYQAEVLRERLLKELDDRLCTPAEIAHLSTYLGLMSGREQVRKRINQWAARGRIDGHEEPEKPTRYRFGKVYELLCQDDTQRRSA